MLVKKMTQTKCCLREFSCFLFSICSSKWSSCWCITMLFICTNSNSVFSNIFAQCSHSL